MIELNAYLQQHFLNAGQFAARCRLSDAELRGLMGDRLIPAPSYVVERSDTITSYVFGKMPAPGAQDGEYFHPANEVWVTIARNAIVEAGRERAHDALKKRFSGNMQSALAGLNASTWRLRDIFADDRSVIPGGLQARLDSMWDHFLRGTFGLCVADPRSEAAIAWKEVLQEKLVALSDNGAKTHYPDSEAAAMLKLIEAYGQAAMPFSPVEYSVSSRKRLVEDLAGSITKAQTNRCN